MRISSRLLSNAASTYLRLGSTFVIGLFVTWYLLGTAGTVGFGLIALSFATTGLSHSLERALRFGMVRELAEAVSTDDPRRLQRSVSSALRLCLQVAVPLAALVAVLAVLAAWGVFRTPEDAPQLRLALAALIVGEGLQALVRLLFAPLVQTLYAGQRVTIDNLLMVVSRASYAVSAVLVFGVWLDGQDLATQLMGFALTRGSLQLVDVALGVLVVRRMHPGLRWTTAHWDREEYLATRSTIWHSSQVLVLLNFIPMALAVLVNLFFGLTYNSLWQIAVQFSGYAWMLAEGLVRGLSPMTTHLQSQGRDDSTRELLVHSVRYQWAVVLPATLVLGVFARPLLDLWVGGRLAGDPALQDSALQNTALPSQMPTQDVLTFLAGLCFVLLAARVLRAGFYAVEQVLYGLGRVRSYAWCAKWSLLLAVTLTTGLFTAGAGLSSAAWALLASVAIFSPWTVLRVMRREIGLGVGELLRRSLLRPLAVSAAWLPLLLVARSQVGDSVLQLTSWLAVLGLVLGVASWFWILRPTERERLIQMALRRS